MSDQKIMKPEKGYKGKHMKPSREQVKQSLERIRQQRDSYIDRYNLTCDDLWVLMNTELHSAILKMPDRSPEGPDRITRSCVLGMHVVHDRMKDVYVVPKKRPPREEFGYYD